MGADLSTPRDEPALRQPWPGMWSGHPHFQGDYAPVLPTKPHVSFAHASTPTDSGRTQSSGRTESAPAHAEEHASRVRGTGANRLVAAWERASAVKTAGAHEPAPAHHWPSQHREGLAAAWTRPQPPQPPPPQQQPTQQQLAAAQAAAAAAAAATSHAPPPAQADPVAPPAPPAPQPQPVEQQPVEQQQQPPAPAPTKLTSWIPRAFSPSPRVVSEDTGLAAARAVFADHPVIKARTPGSVGGYAPAKFSFSTRDKQQAKSWKTWNSVAPTGKDTYKLGKFDVVTTQLFGKEVKKPDVVCSSMNVYRGIDEELAEIAAQEAQQEQQASYEA